MICVRIWDDVRTRGCVVMRRVYLTTRVFGKGLRKYAVDMSDIVNLLRNGVSVTDPRIRPHVETADAELVALFGSLKGFTPMARHRFLIARELDVQEAHAMMIRRVEWARSTLPIPMSDSVREEMDKGKVVATPYNDLKTDRPIVVIRSRLFDPKIRSMDDSVRATIATVEQSLGRSTSESVCVYYDRTGFDIKRNLDIDFLREVIRVLSDNYPETLSSIYVYPTGGVFKAVWTMVAALLNKRTRNKVVMPKSLDELLEAIPTPLVMEGL